MTTVTVQDLKTVHFCNRGGRLFFERHGLDWSDFIKNGVDAEALRATGDAMALAVVEEAERREARGRDSRSE